MKGVLLIIVMMIVLHSLQSFTASSNKEDVTVYICEKGKVYHSQKDCRGLKNAKNNIKAISLKEVPRNEKAM